MIEGGKVIITDFSDISPSTDNFNSDRPYNIVVERDGFYVKFTVDGKYEKSFNNCLPGSVSLSSKDNVISFGVKGN